MKYFILCITTIFVVANINATELTVTVLDTKKIAIKNMVVYATPVEKTIALPMNKESLFIDQKGRKFSPYITVTQKGKSINFVNKDDITHHIYSVSGENRFEFKIKAGASKTTAPMTATEEVAMGCNIHDWMSGYALVVDTPYFGKTDDEGKFTFSLRDAGEYILTAWHPQLDVLNYKVSQTVIVGNANQKKTIELPKNLLPIPEQIGQDEFDFLEEY